MSNEINLLIKKDNNLLKEQSKLKVFRLIAIGSLLTILLISLSIFLLNQKLSNSSMKVEKDRESILVEMKPFRENESNIIIVNNRIDNITKVLKKRMDVYKILNTILGKIPDGILTETLEFSEKKISMNITSVSLIPIDVFFNDLIEMAKRKEIVKSLTLESLDASPLTGSYKISIDMNI